MIAKISLIFFVVFSGLFCQELPEIGDHWIEPLPFYPAIVSVHHFDECQLCGRELNLLYREFYPEIFFQSYLATEDEKELMRFSFTRKLLFDVKKANFSIAGETPVIFVIDSTGNILLKATFPGSKKTTEWLEEIKGLFK